LQVEFVSAYIVQMLDRTSDNQALWNAVHASGWGRYPPEELVRFVARNFSVPQGVKALEVGCGAGANLWLLAREGFDVTGIDFAENAVTAARKRLADEGLQGDLRVADFTSLPFDDASFDLVIDIGGITSTDLQTARSAFSQCHRVLKPDGKLFSMLLASDTNAERLKRYGTIHYYTRAEVETAFADFAAVSIDTMRRTDGGGEWLYSHFLVTAQRGRLC
jgi:ubiquinone/menaquinone biosynthesis C-methylase UbiE